MTMTPDWLAEAVPVDAPVEVDIAFTVREDFYHGPADAFLLRRSEMSVPLYRPALPFHGHAVLASQVLGREGELVAHYRDVLAKAAVHGTTLSRPSSYFWTSPVVRAEGRFEIDLPWHDTYAEARRFIASLLNDTPGELYADQDQGWQLDIYRADAFVYARRRDPDDDVTLVNARFAWRPFVREARNALARGDALIAALQREFGADHWS